MGLFGNKHQPVQLKILSAYAPVRCRTATVRATWVVGGMIGICSIIRLLAELKLAAENDQFLDRVFPDELDFHCINCTG